MATSEKNIFNTFSYDNWNMAMDDKIQQLRERRRRKRQVDKLKGYLKKQKKEKGGNKLSKQDIDSLIEKMKLNGMADDEDAPNKANNVVTDSSEDEDDILTELDPLDNVKSNNQQWKPSHSDSSDLDEDILVELQPHEPHSNQLHHHQRPTPADNESGYSSSNKSKQNSPKLKTDRMQTHSKHPRSRTPTSRTKAVEIKNTTGRAESLGRADSLERCESPGHVWRYNHPPSVSDKLSKSTLSPVASPKSKPMGRRRNTYGFTKVGEKTV